MYIEYVRVLFIMGYELNCLSPCSCDIIDPNLWQKFWTDDSRTGVEGLHGAELESVEAEQRADRDHRKLRPPVCVFVCAKEHLLVGEDELIVVRPELLLLSIAPRCRSRLVLHEDELQTHERQVRLRVVRPEVAVYVVAEADGTRGVARANNRRLDPCGGQSAGRSQNVEAQREHFAAFDR